MNGTSKSPRFVPPPHDKRNDERKEKRREPKRNTTQQETPSKEQASPDTHKYNAIDKNKHDDE